MIFFPYPPTLTPTPLGCYITIRQVLMTLQPHSVARFPQRQVLIKLQPLPIRLLSSLNVRCSWHFFKRVLFLCTFLPYLYQFFEILSSMYVFEKISMRLINLLYLNMFQRWLIIKKICLYRVQGVKRFSGVTGLRKASRHMIIRYYHSISCFSSYKENSKWRLLLMIFFVI